MDALDLSRRGFFGATSAALVAMLAPRRAYSFLTANPLAVATWNGVAFPEPNVMVITSAAQARKMFGGSRRGWEELFDAVNRPVTLHFADARIEMRAVQKAAAGRLTLEPVFGAKEAATK